MRISKTIVLFLAISCAGNILAQSTFSSRLPLKPRNNATIAGIVECDGKPVANVPVSDGYQITRTDKKGAYYIKSKKQNRQVFITVPSGYEAVREDVVPCFWTDLELAPDKYERHDFQLRKNNNLRHGMILITDTHFHGKRRDEATFSNYMDTIRREVSRFTKKSIPVYSIGLGDAGYDNYWYETGVDIERTREILNENGWPAPFYNVMGNHDSDPAVCQGDSTDFLAAVRFMKTYGPRYYSADIGKIHYVFLDNIVFLNDMTSSPQNEGVKGKRNYKEMITQEQLEWLEKDLAPLPASTPIVLAMHCPVHVYRKATTDIQIRPDKSSALRLKELVEPFDKVIFLSGHTHKNGLVRAQNGKNTIIDLNLLSTSGSIWWNSSFNQKNLAHDGNPVGFELMEVDGDSIKWRFVPFEYPSDMQFKAWDVNALKKFFSTDTEARTLQKYLPKWGSYENLPDNSVLIQVWAWDPAGKLEVSENGSSLEIEPVWETHPDYYAMTAIQKAEWTGDYKKGLREPKKARLFLVRATDGTSPLEISYTDAFGRTDQRIFNRPHLFDSNVK